MNREMWTVLEQTSSEHTQMLGDYVFEANISLKIREEPAYLTETAGCAHLHIVDEAWVDTSELSLIKQIHFDFNDDKNWNDYTPFEYLEDALTCVDYGTSKGLSGKVGVLQKIEIHDTYKGNGFFHTFIRCILPYFKKMGCEYIILQPHPFGGSGNQEIDKLINQLRTFYSSYGFQLYPNPKVKNPYMYLDVKETMERANTLLKGNERKEAEVLTK